MDLVVTCMHCGTKLKLRKAMAGILKEVRCAKCHKKTPVKTEGAATPEADKPKPAAPPAPVKTESEKPKPAVEPTKPLPAPSPAAKAEEAKASVGPKLDEKPADKVEPAAIKAPVVPAVKPVAAPPDPGPVVAPTPAAPGAKPLTPLTPAVPEAKPGIDAGKAAALQANVDKVSALVETSGKDLAAVKGVLRSYYQSELEAARKRVEEFEKRLRELG